MSNKKSTLKKVQQVENFSSDSTDARNTSNSFAALVKVNDDDGKAAGEHLQLFRDQNSSSTPAILNLTSLGAQILENLNPLHAFTGNLTQNTVAKDYKSTNDGVDDYRVGLNTSNHDNPPMIILVFRKIQFTLLTVARLFH